MNDKNPKSDVKPDKTAGRRKRAAPTIDLEAKEIPPVPQSDAASQEAVAPQPPDAEPQVTASADELAEAAAPKSALGGSATFGSTAKQPDAETSANSTSGSAPSDGRTKTLTPPGSFMPLVVGGVAGATAAALIVAVAWSTGLFATDATHPDPRIAALEAQIKELQARPAAVSNNTGASDALGARIAKIEGDLSRLASTPADDSALKSLGVALTALSRRYDDLAATIRDAQSRADAAEKAAADLRRNVQDVSKTAAAGASSAELDSLQQRLAALEEQSKTARAEIAKATESDRAARLALSAAAVRDAVLRGAPFAEELAQAKALGADEKALAPLWPLAASGVPSARTLAKQLTDLLPQMRKATDTPAASGGFLERLQANAEHLVRVRPAGAPAGDDASAVLARIEQNAAQDNIAAALADVGTLPQPARQIASDWVTRAVARQKALDAARDFAAHSTRSLGAK